MNFNTARDAFRDTITYMNVAADHSDKTKNIMEYGRLQVFAMFLEDMGHTIDGSIITDEDTGMRRCVFMTMDGQSLGNYTKNVPDGLFTVITPEKPEIKEEPYDEDKK